MCENHVFLVRAAMRKGPSLPTAPLAGFSTLKENPVLFSVFWYDNCWPQSQNHPGRTRSHLRIRHLSIHLQLQQARDENGDPPGRYRLAKCGTWLAPPRKDNLPPTDKKSCMNLQLQQTRGENSVILRVDKAPHAVEALAAFVVETTI